MMGSLRSLCLAALFCSVHGQSAADWMALNASVQGRLNTLAPLALPCFTLHGGVPTDADEGACNLVRENYASTVFRSTRPNGYTFLQNEICIGDEVDQCLLNDSNKPVANPGVGSSCNQGSVPSWYIEVRESSDVVAAFKFSKTHGTPLAIKNSGHDLMTRNTQKGGLSLWVGRLQEKEYHEDFIPLGCGDTERVGRAATIGTGSSTTSVHDFLVDYNSTFVGGFSGTVSSSGGWVQGGGHSVLSPVFGLGADRVVQFRAITPDGQTRTANKCQNSDLFWALRGGGGGTFGVVLDATHRVEPAAPVAWASITIPANSSQEVVFQWLELQARESLRWGREGWGGHAAGLYLRRLNPIDPIANLNDGGASAKASLQKAIDFALAHNGTSTVEVLPTFHDVFTKYINPSGLQNSGAARFMSTRLIPQDMFQDDDGINKVMDYMREVTDLGFDPKDFYIAVGTPFVADVTRKKGCRYQQETAMHPAWYSALWQVSVRFNMAWNATNKERLDSFTALGRATVVQEKLTGTAGGTYGLETNPFTTNWQTSWWGPKYDRLLEVKNKYDPDRLLNCWKCVGFTDEYLGSERYRCNSKMQYAIDRAISE